MKGATPRGPMVVIANKARAETRPSGTGWSRPRAARSRRPGPLGTNCVPRPTAIASRTAGLTSSVGGRPPGDDAAQQLQGDLDRVRTEERPPDAHEGEGPSALRPAGRRRVGWLGQDPRLASAALPAAHGEVETVQAAPDHEPPGRPVPQAAEQHRDHEVDVRPALTATAAAEGDVQVVAEPSRQRDVPSAPELLDRASGVRPVEVDRELEPQELRDADGDVGVAAEVAVDLHGVGDEADDGVDRGAPGGVAEDGVDDRAGQEVRDHDLLEQAAQDQPHRRGHVHVARVALLVELRDELVGPHDRPGHQVREERQVQEQVAPARRRERTAVDVDHVGDRHERVEGDAHGQHHLDQRRRPARPQGRCHVRRGDGEEAVVLEVQERGERRGHAERHGARPTPRVLTRGDGARRHLADHADTSQEEDVAPVRPRVEHVGRDDHEREPHPTVVVQEPVAQEDHQEEQREVDRREEHPARC